MKSSHNTQPVLCLLRMSSYAFQYQFLTPLNSQSPHGQFIFRPVYLFLCHLGSTWSYWVSSDFIKYLEYRVERPEHMRQYKDVSVHTLLTPPDIFQSPITIQISQLNFLLFHCFFPILKPPNSYLPYSLRQGCKILSTLMCTLPCASDKMLKLKGPKQKPKQTVSRNQALEQGWLQTELNTTAWAMTRTRPPSLWLGSGLCAHSAFRLYVGPQHQSLWCYVQVQREREKAFSSNPARVLKFILIELTMVDSNNRTGHGLSQDQWHFRPRNVPPRAH